MLTGQVFVQPTDPHALDAAQLVDRPALGRRLPEPELEHLAHHLETRHLVEGETRLQEEPVGARATGLTQGVQGHPRP